MRYIFHSFAAMLLTCSCGLFSPDDVKNPNVGSSDFETSPQAMTLWVNGAKANFAVAMGNFAEYTGLLSDDLYNNSSRSSKTYDQLDINYTDGEVFKLSTHIGKLLQTTDYGLDILVNRAPDVTDDLLFHLHYIRACAYLLAGENFVALPSEAHGEVMEGDGLITLALKELDNSEETACSARDRALLALLKARGLRDLGRMSEAVEYAKLSLNYSPVLLYNVEFDGFNGCNNSLHEYIALGLFTILDRMQYQVVKFPMADYWNEPIAIAKSEEAYLIMAEAAAWEGRLDEARTQLELMLQLVEDRASTATMTSVTAEQLAEVTDRDSMLVTIYLLRQEVFFGEARRSADLGIRLPMAQVEVMEYDELPAQYSKPFIPAYLDSIRTEIDKHEDMNDLLVEWLTEK